MSRRDDTLEVRQSANSVEWYVRCVAPNGEVLWTTEMYASKANALRSAERLAVPSGGALPIEVVERHAPFPDGGAAMSLAERLVADPVDEPRLSEE